MPKRGRRTGALRGILVLFVCSLFVTVTTPPSYAATTYRFMTYNVNMVSDVHPFPARASAVVSEMTGSSPAAIALQEIGSVVEDKINLHLPSAYNLTVANLDTGGRSNLGLAWKPGTLDYVSSTAKELTVSNSVSGCTKKGRVAFFQLKEKVATPTYYVVANVHLTGGDGCAAIRSAEITKLRSAITNYMSESVTGRFWSSIMVMGDFNVGPDASELNGLENQFSTSSGSSSRTFYLKAAKPLNAPLVRPTLNWGWDANTSNDGNGYAPVRDSIWYQTGRQGQGVFKVQNNISYVKNASTKISPSDHYPLRVDFEDK